MEQTPLQVGACPLEANVVEMPGSLERCQMRPGITAVCFSLAHVSCLGTGVEKMEG